MKKKIVTILFLSLPIIYKCNNDDSVRIQNKGLSGKWSLTKIKGGIEAIDLNYAIGEVTWIIDEGYGNIVIENNASNSSQKFEYAKFETGSYSFEIISQEEQGILYIDQERQGSLNLNENLFFIDGNLSLDGYIYEFSRFVE